MPQCLISFGANIGNARKTIEQAAEELRTRLSSTERGFRLSPLFKTPPVGGPTGQPPFLNAVAAIETGQSPWEVWHAVRDVEQILGRERFQRWEARRIDLDILLFDNVRIWTPQLKIPHPRMCMRRFILEPAAQVARDWLDPVTGMSVGQLAASLRNDKGSFVLHAAPEGRPQGLLEEVARMSMAQWLTEEDRSEAKLANGPMTRWVSLTLNGHSPLLNTDNHFQIHAVPEEHLLAPKLAIYLVDPHTTSGAQWEDIHRSLANRLNLCAVSPGQTSAGERETGRDESPQVLRTDSPTTFPGIPRYLLATDDRQWAVHEMVAALEAMDCPVEPVMEDH